MAMFDLAKTEVLERLLSAAPDARDQAWLDELQDAAPDASMAAGDPQVQHGPDGFPYFMLQLPPVGQAFETFCVNHILEPCTENGFGCVLQGREDSFWVLTYGNLWSQRLFGAFNTAPPGDRRMPPPEARLLTGTPSDDLMPDWARRVLRSWLEYMGFKDVGVALVVDGEGYGDAPADWLSFSVFPEQFETPDHYTSFLYRLNWFLPPRFHVLGVGPGVFEYTAL